HRCCLCGACLRTRSDPTKPRCPGPRPAAPAARQARSRWPPAPLPGGRQGPAAGSWIWLSWSAPVCVTCTRICAPLRGAARHAACPVAVASAIRRRNAVFAGVGTHRSQWSLSAACPGDRIVGLLFLPGSRMSPPAQVQARVAGLAVVSALAIVYVVWGSTYLGIRFALEGGWPPLLAVSGARFIVAGAAMYAFLRWRGVPAPTRAQWKNLAVMGLTLLLLGNGCVVLSEQSVSSGLAAVAVASVPLWMGVFGVVYGQRPTRIEWLGIAIGFAGVLWLNAGSSLTASPVGLVLLLVAPIGWAFGSVWSRGRDLPPPFMAAAGQMLCGGVMIVAVGLLRGES